MCTLRTHEELQPHPLNHTMTNDFYKVKHPIIMFLLPSNFFLNVLIINIEKVLLHIYNNYMMYSVCNPSRFLYTMWPRQAKRLHTDILECFLQHLQLQGQSSTLLMHFSVEPVLKDYK